MKPAVTFGVPQDLAKQFKEFARKGNIRLNIVSNLDATIQVVRGEEERMKSDLATLHIDGWIPCETARAVAKRLGISTLNMGKLLDYFNVKVRECALGCFK